MASNNGNPGQGASQKNPPKTPITKKPPKTPATKPRKRSKKQLRKQREKHAEEKSKCAEVGSGSGVPATLTPRPRTRTRTPSTAPPRMKRTEEERKLADAERKRRKYAETQKQKEEARKQTWAKLQASKKRATPKRAKRLPLTEEEKRRAAATKRHESIFVHSRTQSQLQGLEDKARRQKLAKVQAASDRIPNTTVTLHPTRVLKPNALIQRSLTQVLEANVTWRPQQPRTDIKLTKPPQYAENQSMRNHYVQGQSTRTNRLLRKKTNETSSSPKSSPTKSPVRKPRRVVRHWTKNTHQLELLLKPKRKRVATPPTSPARAPQSVTSKTSPRRAPSKKQRMLSPAKSPPKSGTSKNRRPHRSRDYVKSPRRSLAGLQRNWATLWRLQCWRTGGVYRV